MHVRKGVQVRPAPKINGSGRPIFLNKKTHLLMDDGRSVSTEGMYALLDKIVSFFSSFQIDFVYPDLLLRGTILNRTYGPYKNQYISLFLLTIFGPIHYGPP